MQARLVLIPNMLKIEGRLVHNVKHANMHMTVQALQKDLCLSPAGKLMLMQGQQPTLEAVFESVDMQPMASASIAQVGSCCTCSRQHASFRACLTFMTSSRTIPQCVEIHSRQPGFGGRPGYSGRHAKPRLCQAELTRTSKQLKMGLGCMN